MWMNLLIDTTLPICGNASQRPHGSFANDGDHNIGDAKTALTASLLVEIGSVSGYDAMMKTLLGVSTSPVISA